MGFIWTIIIGFVVGLFARALMPGKDAFGIIITTLLGIGGAIVGKFIGQAFGIYGEKDPAGFLMSLIGAMILLFLYNMFLKKKELDSK